MTVLDLDNQGQNLSPSKPLFKFRKPFPVAGVGRGCLTLFS